MCNHSDLLFINNQPIYDILRVYYDLTDVRESKHSVQSRAFAQRMEDSRRFTMTTGQENEMDLRQPSTFPLGWIYDGVLVKHGNSRNMADISNDYHLRHRTYVYVGIAFLGTP